MHAPGREGEAKGLANHRARAEAGHDSNAGQREIMGRFEDQQRHGHRPPTIATAIAAMPISAASDGSIGRCPGDRQAAREQLSCERADEERCEEQAAAESEAKRDCGCQDLHEEDEQKKAQSHLGAKIEVKRAMACRKRLGSDDPSGIRSSPPIAGRRASGKGEDRTALR